MPRQGDAQRSLKADWLEGYSSLADDALATAVVIKPRTCPCCDGERPGPGRDTEDLWQLCRDELTGVDIRIDGWDIRGRWFGVVVGATPRLGELPRGQTIPWRVIAGQIASRERRSSR